MSATRHRSIGAILRGWWHWAAIACIVGGVAAGLVAYQLAQPVYRCTGRIVVLPEAENGAAGSVSEANLTAHRAQVERQMAVLTSHDLITTALAADAWKGFTVPPLDASRFSNHLVVRRPEDRRTHIDVAFDHLVPGITHLAVTTLLDAYENETISRTAAKRAEKMRELIAGQKSQHQQLARLNREMSKLASSVGPLPIDTALAQATERSTRLAALRDGVRRAAHLTSLDSPEQPIASSALTPIGEVDSRFDRWLQERMRIERELTRLGSRMGRNAPPVIALHRDLDLVTAKIRRYVRAGAEQEDRNEALRAADLQALSDRYEAALRRAEGEAAKLGTTHDRLKALVQQSGAVRALIEQASAEAKRVEREQDAAPSIQVASRGSAPTTPHRAAGWHWVALAAFGGGLVGLLPVLLVASIDDRMLRPDQATINPTDAPLLGTVPKIDGRRADHRRADLTALCIHEIRAMLQVTAESTGAKAFAITSPGPGSGKTSLTVGLASSLALSGTRTLLVDCNLGSRLHRDVSTGAPDASEQSATPGEAGPAPEPHATGGSQSLDQVMLEMGYLSANDTERCLALADASTGILSILAGAPWRRCVLDTNIPMLSILPAFGAQPRDIGKMSTAFFKDLVAQVREAYDIVLFDTGSIPGSVEALFVTGAADAVIVVAGRGETQRRFGRTLAQLRMIGAHVAGTVFNRASDRNLNLNVPATKGADDGTRTAMDDVPSSVTTGSGLLAAAVQSQAHVIAPPAADSPDVPESTELAETAESAETADKPPAATEALTRLDEEMREDDDRTPTPAAVTPFAGARQEPDPDGTELDAQIQRLLDDVAQRESAAPPNEGGADEPDGPLPDLPSAGPPH